MVGVSLSVGICCDGPAILPGEEVFTVGDGVYWPHDRYRDFRPMPQSWIGYITLSSDVKRDEDADDDAAKKKKKKKGACMHGFTRHPGVGHLRAVKGTMIRQ